MEKYSDIIPELKGLAETCVNDIFWQQLSFIRETVEHMTGSPISDEDLSMVLELVKTMDCM
jgi:hypothetical protein